MKKAFAAVLLFALLAGAATASARSKVWDKIYEQVTKEPQQPQTQPAPDQTYVVEIKMAGGETFKLESPDAEGFDDVEFSGNMKLEQPDGTYYLNSAQVQYIKVAPRKQ